MKPKLAMDVVAVEGRNFRRFINSKLVRNVFAPLAIFLLFVPAAIEKLKKNFVAGPNHATATSTLPVFTQPCRD